MYLRNCESVWCKDDDDDGDSVALEMLPSLAILQLEFFLKVLLFPPPPSAATPGSLALGPPPPR